MIDGKKGLTVLGIETSCDETGVAVFCPERGLLAHRLHSQIPVHAEHGGVVPELASRDHIRYLVPLVRAVLQDAALSQPDAVAYTAGPGLMGALMVGASTGRAMAAGWRVPAIEVHHLEGHLLAPMLDHPELKPPFLALLVSGGHTLLIDVARMGAYEILGESRDDAVGEAFDKTAKILGLPYPGGRFLADLATRGDPDRFSFPIPMIQHEGLDFSFSGLKTYVRNVLAQLAPTEQDKADVARAFEEAAIKSLVIKVRRALDRTGYRTLVVAGGVSANLRLRASLQKLGRERCVEVYFPRQEFCTDNGAMIAYAGYYRLVAGDTAPLVVAPKPRWPISALQPMNGDVLPSE